MTQPVDPAPGAPPQDPAPGASDNTKAPGAPTVDVDAPVDIDALPANVRGLISGLRKEAASARTTAKAKAAEQARTELMQQVSTALGLSEPAADPKQLTEQLTAAREASALASTELDVFRTAVRLGADAERLLDSRQFVAAINDLPDEDFGTELEKLVKSRLETDPSLRAGGGSQAKSRVPAEALQSGSLPSDGSGPGDPNEWMRRRATSR